MATILSTWMIRTLVGTGESGYTGDGGPSLQARLNEPKGVTIDCHGNVYVADSENHVVRKVDRATGVISTVAGMFEDDHMRSAVERGSPAQRTDEDPLAEGTGETGSAKFTQQADLSGTVRYWTNQPATSTKRYGGDGKAAVQAQLNFPTAIAVDREGNLYIADTMNHRVRMVDSETGVISTLAGTGHARFSGDGGPANKAALNEPAALAVDDAGRLYVADQSNHRVRVIDLKTGVIRTVAGTGISTYDGDGKAAVDTALAGPSGLALMDNRLYIADTFNNRVRCVELSSGLMTTVAGDGGVYRYESPSDAPSPSLSRPTGIALDHEGRLFLTDSDNHLVRQWDGTSGVTFCMAGQGLPSYSGDGGIAREASLCYPFGIVADRDGTLLVADTFNHRIRVLALE
ncbi:MAG: SMP-30/gluconolactonase/LRE family protein [Nitrospira sp.]|nr:SMP-30/gluconolactonase/LRE family protein [Nitrospira sp.]